MFSNLTRSNWLWFSAAIGFSIASGFASVSLIALINEALSAGTEEKSSLMWLFAGAVIVSVAASAVSGILFHKVGQQVLSDLRIRIVDNVIKSKLSLVEKVGSARIQSALTEDSIGVSNALVALPNLVTNLVIVVGCLAYMAWLALDIFFYALISLAVGGISYHFVHVWAIKYLKLASDAQTDLYEQFLALTDGVKELKLNQRKRADFMNVLLSSAIDSVRIFRVKGLSIFRITTGWGNLVFFVFVGLVLFVIVGDGADDLRLATGFSLVVLYMLTPLQNVLNSLPAINIANVAWARIEQVSQQISEHECEINSADALPAAFSLIQLDQAVHSYYHEKSDDMFTMGPIDLSFVAGELVFLVGGNGSGKTSLAKLLLGLYLPSSGSLRLNGDLVDIANVDGYRQLFSAVFSDFFLFETLIGCDDDGLDNLANQLIEKFHLDKKVQVVDEKFSTQKLSQGQRKRLALIAAYLEDRPFVVLDEWAADQDPEFKKIFYRELLPQLKAQGKTVLVISHDDRYFDVADRIITMDSGQIVSDAQVRKGDHPVIADSNINMAETA